MLFLFIYVLKQLSKPTICTIKFAFACGTRSYIECDEKPVKCSNI